MLPIVCQPRQAYNTLFGSVAEGSAKEEFVAKNNILDFLKDDLKKVEAGLAGPEREQLGAYLESFETLRNRQSRLNEVEHTLREKGPVTNDKYRSKVETDRLDAQFDLAAAALICGITNVVTLSSAAGELDFDITFTGLGIKRDRHQIGHGSGDGGGKLKSGRSIDYPGYGQPRHRTTANMYLTLLHLAGAPRETFGMADPTLKDLDQHGPLEELLA